MPKVILRKDFKVILRVGVLGSSIKLKWQQGRKVRDD